MEYFKLALTYTLVAIIFDIPLYIKRKKTNDFSDLKFRLKLQGGVIFGILAGTFVVKNLLKIDANMFVLPKDLLSAILINISQLFIKKK
ncbi:MAG: hypothetical protein RIN55_06160 [Tissierellaceae bacterium]|nr:hypothetical protein [Tissierellaceae bacterium]